MTWQINVPYRDRADTFDLLSIHENTRAAIPDEREREVSRELQKGIYLRSGCRTYAEVLRALGRADASQRRRLLDRARKSAGLEPTGEVDRARATARAIRDDPPPPPPRGPQRDEAGKAIQECAHPDCTVISPGDGRIAPVAAVRWWCAGHASEAAPGDLDDWQEPPVRVNPRTGLPAMTAEAEQHYRDLGERAKAKRERQQRKDRKRRAQDRERLEKLEADHQRTLRPPAGYRRS